MREIKFRAWDKTRNEWFKHGEICIDMNGNVFLDFMENPRNARFDIEWYTGLKDKNGKEIYEGDRIKQAGHIIGSTKKEKGNIEQAHNGRWFVRLMWESGMECHADIAEDAEIIGNIHQD